MKAVAEIFLLVVLVLSCTVSTYGQETSWRELYTKTTTLYQQGRHSEAAKVAEEALTVAEKTFGSGHPTVAQSINSLAVVYDLQGRHSEATCLYSIRGRKQSGRRPLVKTIRLWRHCSTI